MGTLPPSSLRMIQDGHCPDDFAEGLSRQSGTDRHWTAYKEVGIPVKTKCHHKQLLVRLFPKWSPEIDMKSFHRGWVHMKEGIRAVFQGKPMCSLDCKPYTVTGNL